MADRVAGIAQRDELAVEPDLAGVRAVGAEEEPGGLRPTGADEPGEAEDLPWRTLSETSRTARPRVRFLASRTTGASTRSRRVG